MNKQNKTIEIMDTTLRDGEQTKGLAFTPAEKFTIARALLERLCVDRIEVASATISKKEMQAIREITAWAKESGFLEKIEVLGFCDKEKSIDWIGEAGGKVVNILVKGSLKHLQVQLNKVPSQHIDDITKTVEYCIDNGLTCNCYPEDWSNGMQEENDYTRWLISQLVQLPIKRIMLPDTLGVLNPHQVKVFISELVERFPSTHFDFHGHNDYGLATANSLAAVKAGVKGVHATCNGLGERAGNAALDEVVVVIKDMTEYTNSVREDELVNVSKLVELYSGYRIAFNKPISGNVIFTHTAGIHADGDQKGNLYTNMLRPERFKCKRNYALGKLSGKANLEINLESIGLQLSEQQKELLLERILKLGEQKRIITAEDIPFIITDGQFIT